MPMKKWLISGCSLVLLGVTGLVGGDVMAEDSPSYDQIQIYSDAQTNIHIPITLRHNDFIEQTRSELAFQRAKQLDEFNTQLDKSVSDQINTSREDITAYRDHLLSEIQQEKQAIQATMLDTYKKNKKEEINKRTTEALQELLD